MQLLALKFAWIVALILSTPAHAYTVISAENPDMMGWDTKSLSFAINAKDCPRDYDMAMIATQAMAVWNAALGDKIQLKLGNQSNTSADDAVNGGAADTPVIICDPQFVAHTHSDGNTTPGQSGILLDTGTGHLVYGYTLLNVDPTTLANIQNIPIGRVAAIVAHEMGHVLGLGHSADPSALMYFDVSNKTHPVLSQDDIDGAISLYTPRPGKDGSPLGCGVIYGSHNSSGGALAEISGLWILLYFALFLMKRRRTIPASQS